MSNKFEATPDFSTNFNSPEKVDRHNLISQSDRSVGSNVSQQGIDLKYHSTNTPALNLNIDRLVLEGFPASARRPIGTAIQAELTRLFTERGIPPSLTQQKAIEQLNGGNFEVTAHTPHRIVGTRIARAIYRGLSHE